MKWKSSSTLTQFWLFKVLWDDHNRVRRGNHDAKQREAETDKAVLKVECLAKPSAMRIKVQNVSARNESMTNYTKSWIKNFSMLDTHV